MKGYELLQLIYFFLYQNRMISFLTLTLMIGLFVGLPGYLSYKFVGWVRVAIEGKDGIVQWAEFAAVVFLIYVGVGLLTEASDWVMTVLVFGVLGAPFARFIKHVRFPFNKKENTQTEEPEQL